jgi:predicted aminopeptidase
MAVVWYYELIWYGLQQGYGQVNILWNAEKNEDFVKNPQNPDSLKVKVRLIQEIKKFAEDSLGITPSKNYTKIYNQKGKPILWITTASLPYQLKAYEWSFGFLGKFSYKGRFVLKKAKNDSVKLAQQGYDVDIDEVSAWSTLGWFNDPILSSMLRRSEADLANLIIHELTHGTLYVKDNVDFNENLASFIGDKGALLFLEQKYGKNSKQAQRYEYNKKDNERFSEHILRGTKELQKLYENIDYKNITDTITKNKIKYELITKIVLSLDTVSFQGRKYNPKRLEKFKPNNAFFIDFVRYRAKQNDFEKEFKEKFNGNLKAYLNSLKTKYGK